MSKLRVALVQLAADADVAANLDRASALVRKAAEGHPSLIALPEVLHYRGPVAGFRETAAAVPGPLTAPFQELAHSLNTWILLGSVAEKSDDALRPYNTSVLLDPAGNVAATYRKRHLFDVSIENGPADRESARITPGVETVAPLLEGVADGSDVRLGMSICFDLRFPELYRELTAAGAVDPGDPRELHRGDRTRPLGSSAPSSGNRERRVRPRPGPVRHRRGSAEPRPEHDRGPVGDRRGAGAGRAGRHQRGAGPRSRSIDQAAAADAAAELNRAPAKSSGGSPAPEAQVRVIARGAAASRSRPWTRRARRGS